MTPQSKPTDVRQPRWLLSPLTTARPAPLVTPRILRQAPKPDVTIDRARAPRRAPLGRDISRPLAIGGLTAILAILAFAAIILSSCGGAS